MQIASKDLFSTLDPRKSLPHTLVVLYVHNLPKPFNILLCRGSRNPRTLEIRRHTVNETFYRPTMGISGHSSLFRTSNYTVTYPECMSCVGPWKLINNNSSFSEWPLFCTARHCAWHSAISISSSILRELKRELRECSDWIV